MTGRTFGAFPLELLNRIEALAKQRLGASSMPIPPEMALILISVYREQMLAAPETLAKQTASDLRGQFLKSLEHEKKLSGSGEL